MIKTRNVPIERTFLCNCQTICNPLCCHRVQHSYICCESGFQLPKLYLREFSPPLVPEKWLLSLAQNPNLEPPPEGLTCGWSGLFVA